MTDRMERHYRRAMLAYPRGYRAANTDAVVATLLEVRGPVARETLALVRGGLAERLRERTARTPWWAGGLHLAALAVLASAATWALPLMNLRPVSGVLLVAAALLTALGRVRLALPFALALTPHPVRPLIGPDDVGVAWYSGRPLAADYGPWTLTVILWAPAVLLAVLSLRRGPRLPRRSLLWPAVIAAMAVYAHSLNFDTAPDWEPSFALLRTACEAGALLLVLAATALVRDARWALAATVYLACTVAPAALLAANSPHRTAAYGTLAALTLLAIATSRRKERTA
ncbi:hypothetical protein [Actinomadura parmotrematis]|uniref:Integral membrane protein n=1 Tax=Actinomadura parmotrematis TaxID=2864039 RepID=A0ABS7G2S3_9ACTN|nr:hypothetical protein [Actinomadura parmotrematis]MBW8487025.1 hypothetical protein [Actinomadura parmotrematis]